MKVLIFGPSGSGKTHISRVLQNSGINAFDGDEIEACLLGMINKESKYRNPKLPMKP